MSLRNSPHAFGLLTRLLHWSAAALTLGLVALGWWMVDLGYYDTWYNRAPQLHEVLGLLVLLMGLAMLLVNRIIGPRPAPPSGPAAWQRRAAALMHAVLYLGLVLLPVTGYLTSTASGQAVDVYGLFAVPALGELPAQWRDLAIDIHYVFAYAVPLLVVLHAGAALKHHFIDRDDTLSRMLGGRRATAAAATQRAAGARRGDDFEDANG